MPRQINREDLFGYTDIFEFRDCGEYGEMALSKNKAHRESLETYGEEIIEVKWGEDDPGE